ncbi:MAG: hypothetical protein FWD87_03940 [Spirochaetaceae bacterium]|nr:hypothetical protein [Spirochaetaceae bacterium]
MRKVKIALFHYHFLPGGITTVAVNAVNAIIKYASLNSFIVEEIVFISGREENLESIIQEKIIKEKTDTVIKYDVDNTVDYSSDNDKYNEQEIEEKILLLFKKYEGFIWWTHNYHLGKNPVFTRVITEYLQKNNNQNAILQIHDFPECARPDNYRILVETEYTIYPLINNVRYVTINARDERYLKEAGMPDNMSWLLYDPVSGLSKELSQDSKNKSAITKRVITQTDTSEYLQKKKVCKEKLVEQFKKFFPALNPENPFALYPVRTIRRKNILEAALLAKITNRGFNLIVTLPGVSTQELKYSDTVKECFEKGYIPGIWGCGSKIYGEPVPFENIVSASDFVISSSIMEGFGYHMIDSLLWSKPVITKYLDIQEGFSDVFKNTASFFYDFVTVPVKQNDREKIKQLYFDSIRRYTKIMEKNCIDLALHQIDSILNRDLVDFSYLPVYLQIEILTKVSHDKVYKKEVKALNSSLTEKLLKTIKTKQNYDPLKLADYFSFRSFATTFFKIINSFDNNLPKINLSKDDSNENDKSHAISQNLLHLFFRPEFLRLLLSER